MKRKRDITTGILSQLPTARLIPPRLHALYYSILDSYGITTQDTSNQIIIHNIAWTFCKVRDCQDMTRCYSVTMDLPKEGDRITTLADNRDKMKELELLPSLQRQLIGWINSLRAEKKQAPDTTEDEFALAFASIPDDSHDRRSDQQHSAS